MPGLREDRFLNEASASQREVRASLGMLLAGGGDARIRLDPITRRNRYGVATAPFPDEISFASTTANTISEAGFAIAALVLDRLMTPDPASSLSIRQLFDNIRAGIRHLLGIPGSEAILAASGTDAEILALGLAASLATRPLTNILIAPEETGSGVPLAALGRHFSTMTALGAPAAMGEAIGGFAAKGIEVAAVPIRDARGAPRDPSSIDSEAAQLVERALRRGRDVLLHVLDTSKTGLNGVTREAARALMAAAPERVRIVVDACQLRCGLARIKRDLQDGFMVLATGSKFAGGPPFSGVVLLPGALADEMTARAALPKGIAGYSTALDWPTALRNCFGGLWTSQTNIGLGLRWVAALDGITSMAAMDDALQAAIADRFAKEVRARAQNLRRIEFHDDDLALGSSTIVPLAVREGQGSSSAMAEAQRIQAALREEGHGPVCHIGQPVLLKSATVLRVAASAYTLAGVALRMGGGSALDQAFQPVAADLDSLFEKWSLVERQLSIQRNSPSNGGLRFGVSRSGHGSRPPVWEIIREDWVCFVERGGLSTYVRISIEINPTLLAASRLSCAGQRMD